MSEDLIERLRGNFRWETNASLFGLLDTAADEIERLRLRLNEYENLYGPPWWLAESDGA